MTAVTGLVPGPSATEDLEGAPLRAWLADRYALDGDRWLRLNLVTGLGGQITGPSGTSEDLTGGIDRTLMGVIRATGDTVLVGAGSARVEAYTLPARSVLAVATLTGRLTVDDLPEPDGDRRALVLCPEDVAGRATRALGGRARVVAVPGVREHAGRMLDALAAEGLHRVVCEGGGGLVTALLADGAVDEFDQTIAPVALSPGAPLLTGPLAPTAASLAGLLRDGTDHLYARWRFVRR